MTTEEPQNLDEGLSQHLQICINGYDIAETELNLKFEIRVLCIDGFKCQHKTIS